MANDLQRSHLDSSGTHLGLTCSSSSDSEPEDFFLGRRLPQPRRAPGGRRRLGEALLRLLAD